MSTDGNWELTLTKNGSSKAVEEAAVAALALAAVLVVVAESKEVVPWANCQKTWLYFI